MDTDTTFFFLSVLFCLLSISCFTYCWSALHKRGPILLNKYLLLSKEERVKMNRQDSSILHRDYRLAAILFFQLGLLLLADFSWALFCFFDIAHWGAYSYHLSLFLLLPLFIYQLYISNRYKL